MKKTLLVFEILFLLAFFFSCNSNEPGDKMLEAAANGDINTIKNYLDQGVDINYQNSNLLASEETACMKAAEKGQIEALKFLIENGADFKKGNSGGENPISYAGKKGQFEVVMFLINKGEDVNYQENNYGMTPLLYATEYGDVEFIKELIKQGADKSIRTKSGHTLLSIAALNKHVETVKFLLENGADPNVSGRYGWTNLTWAIFTTDYIKFEIPENIKSIVEALLKAGADINQQDADGNTVLIHAAQQDALVLTNYLIEKGANPDIKNNAGGTYLDVLRTNE